MPPSPPVEVHIWCQNTESLDEQALEAADRFLSPEERAQRDRFRSRENRRDYTAAHSLLRQTLSMHAPHCPPEDWRFGRNAFGKPHVDQAAGLPSAPEFNLSHTAGFVACAISSMSVGIDVERVRPRMDYEAIAQSHFSRQEFAALEELPVSARIGRVIELWTLKEAYLKAIGRGLSGHLDSIWFELEPSGSIRFHALDDVDTGIWKFTLFTPQPEVKMAIAVESSQPPRLFLQNREISIPQKRHDFGVTLNF